MFLPSSTFFVSFHLICSTATLFLKLNLLFRLLHLLQPLDQLLTSHLWVQSRLLLLFQIPGRGRGGKRGNKYNATKCFHCQFRFQLTNLHVRPDLQESDRSMVDPEDDHHWLEPPQLGVPACSVEAAAQSVVSVLADQSSIT